MSWVVELDACFVTKTGDRVRLPPRDYPDLEVYVERLPNLAIGFSRRRNCLVHNLIRMSRTNERRLKLRWSQIHTLMQHRMKKPTIGLPVALIGSGPIKNGFIGEEARPHRSNSIHYGSDTRFRGGCRQSVA